MSNIIDSIQLSGVTYTIQGSGGGKAIEAGRGISVTTGETADTVSFNLPISAGTGLGCIVEGSDTVANGEFSHAEGEGTTATSFDTHAEGYYTLAKGNFSHAEGNRTTASGGSSHAEGYSTQANGGSSHAEGEGTITNNQSEHASGKYNVSNTGSTDADKTLFSVGNGTADNARHNAFEIRQNGDIYITSGVTNIKLQDNLGGGNPTVELTQAEYDALVTAGTVSPTTYYIITDAQAGDLTQYWTSAQTQSAITQATSGKVDTSTYNTYTAATDTALGGKQATLVSGTNIKTINNESLLGSGNIDIQGGGSSYSAGTNIDITNDIISCTIPAYRGNSSNGISLNYDSNTASGRRSIAGGSNCKARSENAVALGYNSEAINDNAFAMGQYSIASGFCSAAICREAHATNMAEFACGQHNVSNKANDTFGNSGNTLFSVGNGTSDNARHNAFEIRQNGDIYLSSGGTDIKLQDHLGGGGGGSSYSAGTGIDITNDVISVTGKVDTSAITTSISSSSTDAQVPSAKAVYDQLGGMKIVKLTESEYAALVTKDSNTLYVVVPDPSN